MNEEEITKIVLNSPLVENMPTYNELQQENKELKDFKEKIINRITKTQIDIKRQNPKSSFEAGGITMLVSIMEEIKKIEGDK